MDTSNCTVVFDVGSSSTRVGLSHHQTPKTFPTVVIKSNGEITIGGEGTKIRVQHLGILNWFHIQKIWEHGFDILKVDTKEHPVLLNKPNYPSPKSQNHKIAQIMFEDFGVPALHLNYPAVLALYGHGWETGLVVDSGFCETQFYPVYEGHILEWPITRGLPVGGDYITSLLLEVLKKKGTCTYTTAEEIKEKSFYVCADFKTEKTPEESFVLDDGNAVTLREEKFTIPEALYSSRFECCGIHEYLFNSLYRCDPELRQTLFKNILLTGGNSQLRGFAPRLETELVKTLSHLNYMQKSPQITLPDNPQNLAWIGGTKLASRPTFPSMCMTIQDYNEYGPTLVDMKFF